MTTRLTDAEHAALEAGRRRGDPLADAAARDASASAAMFASVDPPPAWLDPDVLRDGGQLIHRAGPWALVALASASLVEGYADPRGNKPLVMSGQLERRAYRRLQETARFLLSVCAPHGMRGPDGAGWQATMRVRLIHGRVRNLIRASGRWNDAWGEPANQHDTVGTLMMFTVFMLEGLERLGLPVRPDEAERYYQLFRYVGHLLGIEAALLPVDLAHARRTTASIRSVRLPPDDDSRALTAALLDAPLRAARTSGERLFGHGLRQVLLGGTQVLLPDEMTRALDIPRTAARHVVRATGPLAAMWGRLGARGPGRALAVRVGRTLWEAYVDHSLRGGPTPFAPPEQLHGRR